MSGHIYLAPGDRHMTVAMRDDGPVIRIEDGPAICGVRPSADPLFASAARAFGTSVVGVVLTGWAATDRMVFARFAAAGGGAVVQDRASSIIYGMPRAALASAGADRVVAPRLVGSAVAGPAFFAEGCRLTPARASSSSRPVREDHLSASSFVEKDVEQHRARRFRGG